MTVTQMIGTFWGTLPSLYLYTGVRAGRAGRPQFDKTAVAVIMTQEEHKRKWENILQGKQPIESKYAFFTQRKIIY